MYVQVEPRDRHNAAFETVLLAAAPPTTAEEMPLAVRVRLAAGLAAVCGVIFVGIEAPYRPPEATTAVVVVGVGQCLLAAAILLATYTERGCRLADPLAVAFVATHAAIVTMAFHPAP
jgi:hypothetical protein